MGVAEGEKKKQKLTRGGKAQGSGPGSEVNHMTTGKTRHLDQQPLCPTPPHPRVTHRGSSHHRCRASSKYTCHSPFFPVSEASS